MYGIIAIVAYAAIMIGATLFLSRRAKTAENFHVADRQIGTLQAGIGKGQLRVSQFFSSDTASCLVKMNEYYPDLMDRVIRREPNAYLAALYWDSEMFGRSTRTRKTLEKKDNIDYKAALWTMLVKEPGKYFHTEHQLHVAAQYRKMMIKVDNLARPRDYRKMYEALQAGDPKLRTLRAIYQDVFCAYADHCKKSLNKGGDSNG